MAAPIPFTLGSSGIVMMADRVHWQANLLGSVNPNGQDTSAYFSYATNASLTGASSTASTDIGSGTTPVTITASVVNLTADQIYYFTVVGSNASGTVDGVTQSFTAAPPFTPLTPLTVPAASAVTPVTTPHFTWPFAMTNNGANICEQNAGEEIYACLASIVNTDVGQIPEMPSFGIRDYTFAEMPSTWLTLATEIQAQEPRATEDIVASALDETGSAWRIAINPSATEGSGQ